MTTIQRNDHSSRTRRRCFKCTRQSLYGICIIAACSYYITARRLLHKEHDPELIVSGLDSPSSHQKNVRNNVLVTSTDKDEVSTNIWLLSLADGKTSNERDAELTELSCVHKIGIFILSQEDMELGSRYNHDRSGCAPIIFRNEESLNITLSNAEGRIGKISHLRDVQRSILQHEFQQNREMDVYNGAVIIADFDLQSWPSPQEINDRVGKLRKGTHDVICSNGVVIKGKDKKYYDTFATIMLPDSFLIYLERRLFPEPYKNETKAFIRSDRNKSSISLESIWQMFHIFGRKSSTGLVDVRSCFGGLAVYRADLYLESDCTYQLDRDVIDARDINTVMRYANKKEGRPCEHVVLHECFRSTNAKFDIAVDHDMVTVRKANEKK